MQSRQEHMLERVNQAAAEKEGVCLSLDYINCKQKLSFECKNGHIWDATPKLILDGSWCRKCFNQEMSTKRKIGIDVARELARERGGECLSDVYERSGAPLKWRCDRDHEWETTYSHIKVGNWCRICFEESLRHNIKTAQRWAENKGGKLISTEYVGIHEILKWRCEYDHEWDASLGNVMHQKTWCPHCAGRYNYSLEQIAEKMKTRNGICFINSDARGNDMLTFRCNSGHEWATKAAHVFYYNCWCPYCSFRNESYCRKVFESLFGMKFDKCRPKWLINPKTGYPLELDGYSVILLAFEYDGEQHDKFIPFFHKTEDKFIAQQERDKIKKELCIANNVTLINIPHTCKSKQPIDEYIISSLRNIGYEFMIEDIENIAY